MLFQEVATVNKYVQQFSRALFLPGRLLAAIGLLTLGMAILFSGTSTKVLAFTGTMVPLAASPNWTAEVNQAFSEFGVLAVSAGDVNGDGYSDVIVGASRYDNGHTDEGAAFVYHGSPTGLSAVANWMVEGNVTGGRLGEVATAGDVNGDGYDDVLVGGWKYSNGQAEEGVVFVYYGSASGLSNTPSWMAEGDQAYGHFGSGLGTAGDVNGDGFADVIIGAYQYDAGEIDEGRAFVYHGSAAGLSLTPNWTAETNQPYARMGSAATTAGDVNADGYSDVIVTADLYDNGQSDEGAAFVFHGSPTGLSLTSNWIGESNQPNAIVAYAGTAGDVNGDGYADVVIGSPYYTNGEYEEGAVFVYYGSPPGLNSSFAWMSESNQIEAYLGHSLTTTAGDVNGDGYSDLLVGAAWYDGEGRVFLYSGSASGLEATADWTGGSNQSGSLYGYNGGTAGDTNGDGYADIIVGAFLYDNGEPDEGRAFAYYGSSSGLPEPTDVSLVAMQGIDGDLPLQVVFLSIGIGVGLLLLFLYYRHDRKRGYQ
jgi:hypothetical protein